MAAPAKGLVDATQHGDGVELGEEPTTTHWQPIRPIERKLIGWSIGLGVGLLGILLSGVLL